MMTVQASRFTPEVLLAAPRRTPGVPNPSGTRVLYSVSTYSFETHSKTAQIRVMNASDGTSALISEDLTASEPFWIGDNEIAYLKASDNGCTTLMYQDVHDPFKKHMIHHFAGSISSPKAKILDGDRIAICCAAVTTPKDELYWPAAEPKSHSSGKVYDSLFVRHWDTWKTKNHNALWYGQIERKHGKWSLEAPFNNLLAGTKLESPVGPFGGVGDFDIGANGIAFVAKDPEINPARYTKSDVYYVPLKAFNDKPTTPQVVETGDLLGYSNSPTFAHDGKQLVFLKMKHKQYESDKNRLVLVPDVNEPSKAIEFYKTEDGKGGWDRKPDSVAWSADDSELYVAGEDQGTVTLFKLPSSPAKATELPTAIFGENSVSDTRLLGKSKNLFLSTSSHVDSSRFVTLNPDTKEVTDISSSSKHGKSFGLNKSQSTSYWFKGSKGYDISALVVLPSDFDESKKYPLAFLVHGGPQGAWTTDWSTRWNPAIYAEQGYIAVCPNPVGSTGYGQAHTDAIKEDWGGSPYDDLVKCFEYLEKEVPYIDTDRAVALGASYGGYMMNWIQGHDLGRKFKALICHDGVFCTLNQWQTEELFFPEHDFGGTLWDNREVYEKWDPSRHCHNWSTPMLVIHNELDYRLPVSEGLAMFNVLQARNVPSKLVMFPDENHWVLKPENSLVWHREVLDFINKFSAAN